jgi:hypothetical protein
MANLIGSVKVTSPQAAPGSIPVQVQVPDQAGTPYTADTDVIVALDDIPRPSRSYPFPTTRTRDLGLRGRRRPNGNDDYGRQRDRHGSHL